MLLQELRFTGRELHFRVTIKFITLRQETYGDVYVENKEFIPTL